MKILYIIILTALSLGAVGQTTKIEKKNGFRTYLLGNDFRKYENELTLVDSALQNKAKFYRKNDKITLLDHEAELMLTFLSLPLLQFNLTT